MFPDVEVVICELLAPLVPADRTGTTTPPNLESALPFIRVNRFAGGDDGVTDAAAVDVDSFAGNRSDARDQAEAIRQLLTAGAHMVGDVLVDLVRTDVGPVERPWTTARVRRFGGTYTVSCRRIPS